MLRSQKLISGLFGIFLFVGSTLCQIKVTKDINIGVENGGSFPNSFVEVGGKVFFFASTIATGRELWITDGSEAGTKLVKDVFPGIESGIRPMVGVALNGILYFTADDGKHGFELWRSDGTTAGTSLVKDIYPGRSSSSPVNLTVVRDRLFFVANNGTNDFELWLSDGTESGTFMLKDINNSDQNSIDISQLTTVGDLLFFSAVDEHGQELWVSDATSTGTYMVKDLAPGSTSSMPSGIVEQNGRVVFAATSFGNRLIFASDGTEIGTFTVSGIPMSLGHTSFHNFSGQLFFGLNDSDSGTGMELWKTDGFSNTQLVKDIRVGRLGSLSFPEFITFGNHFYFIADDGIHGRELWKSDGTSEGTVLLKDIRTGALSSSPKSLVAAGTNLFFIADDGMTGAELWKTDGTADGTVLVKDISQKGALSASALKSFGNTVIFAANNDITSLELWLSDGSPNGTRLVKDIMSGSLGSSFASNFSLVGDKLIFSAFTPSFGEELWKMEKGSEPTLLLDIMPGSRGSSVAVHPKLVWKNRLFFAAYEPNTGMEIWQTDGSVEGTKILADIFSGVNSSIVIVTQMAATSKFVFFVASNGANGAELWRTDGTTAGTIMVKDISPGIANSYPKNLTVVNDILYFTADGTSFSNELWRTDGSEAGTYLVKDISPGGRSTDFYEFKAVRGNLFFSAFDAIQGYGIWVSDGTDSGTRVIKRVSPNSLGLPQYLAVTSDYLFFVISDGVSGRELWRTDGTDAGTVLVRDIKPGMDGSDPKPLCAIDNTLFFTCNDGVHGYELWKTDGTQQGTVLVKDLIPGPGSGTISSPIQHQGALYFQFFGSLGLWSLWKTEGTACSTIELTQPSALQIIEQPIAFQQKLYFAAHEPTVGMELFEYDPKTDHSTGCKLNQTILFSALSERPFDHPPFELPATASSNLPITFTVSDLNIASISNRTLTINGVGVTTITASQPGDSRYNPAQSVSQQLTVVKASQTIFVAEVSHKTMGDPPFQLDARSTSKLPISYAVQSANIKFDNGLVVLQAPGQAKVKVLQAGDTNFHPAEPRIVEFCVRPAKPHLKVEYPTDGIPILVSSIATGNVWFFNGIQIAGESGRTLPISQAGDYQVQAIIEQCGSEKSDPIVITGLNGSKMEIVLYPNPTDGVLYFNPDRLCNNNTTIELLDALGRFIRSIGMPRGENLNRIDVGDVPSGVYLLLVKCDNGHTFYRFKKQ